MSNRMLAIIGCSLLAILLIRQEFRMDILEEKIDDIIQVKEHIKYTQNDIECLTRNIYYEAGVESRVGKYAVAHVTINRLKTCLLYTSPSPRDRQKSRMPSSA